MSRDAQIRSLARNLACATAALGLAAAAHADIPNGTCKMAEGIEAGTSLIPISQSSLKNSIGSPCGTIRKTAWYSFTTRVPGDITITAAPTFPQPFVALGVANECPEYLSECEIGNSSYPATIRRFGVEGGETILIVVGSVTGEAATNVNLTITVTPPTCGAGGQSLTCCLGGDWNGCNDIDCCSTVCTQDPYCCDQAWDFSCSNRARISCDICLAPDCDGNGLDDTIEYGPDRAMLLSPDYRFTNDADETAFCPQVTPSEQVGMIVKGPLLGDGARQVTMQDSWDIATLDVAATRALFAAAEKSAPTLSILGEDGIRVAASGPSAPAELTLRNLSVRTPHLEIGRGATEGTLRIEESDVVAGSLDALEGTVVVGGIMPSGDAIGGDLSLSGASFIGGNASLQLLPNTSVVSAGKAPEPMVVRGLVDLSPDSVFAVDLVGTLASSWLRTAGQVEGDVQWAGCIRPKSICTIVGDLKFVPLQDGPASRYLWTASQGASRLLTVTGSATLGGTLFIDATGASVGSSAPIIRAASIEGAFDSVQVFGLPPQLALVVAPVSGGAMSELRAQVVTVAQLLGYGEGKNYPLELEPKDTVTADFDNDGLDDLAVSLSAGPDQPGAIALFRGTGDGLQQVSQISVGTDPRGMDAADFDVDGKVDLVIALAGDDAVRVLRNTTFATITFNTLAAVPVGDEPVDVAALDFFVEGASLASSGKDVLVAVAGDGTFVSLKNTDGSISNSGGTTTPSPGGIPTSVGGGDVDNDRVDDGVGGTSGGTTIIPGGVGSYAGSVVYFLPTPHPVTSITLADLNGDGGLDIAATLDANAPRPTPPGTPLVYDTLALIENRPAGFNTTLFDYGYGGRSLSRGDFDADGDEDLAFASRDELAGPAQLRIVRNDMSAAGALLTKQNSPTIDVEPRIVGTISIDGNGDDVLALGPSTNDSVSNLFLQRFAEPTRFGDLNGDGVIDASDLSDLLLSWGEPGPTDLDGSGSTDAKDLSLLLDRWSGK